MELKSTHLECIIIEISRSFSVFSTVILCSFESESGSESECEKKYCALSIIFNDLDDVKLVKLINKIKEFTQDGPPGVGQRIELADIAKKVGVKRVELDKLIDKTIANKGELPSPIFVEGTEINNEEFKEERVDVNRSFEIPSAIKYFISINLII